MPVEFALIFDEFVGELDALSEMAVVRPDSARSTLTPRARIAASNGATLLLAATFEEYVRQQVKAAFLEKVRQANTIEDFPKKIVSSVWKRSLEALARTPFEEVEADLRATDERLASVIAFCLRKDITSDVGGAVAHNESNMRSSQLNALFNQIGISGVSAQCCQNAELVELLGSGTPGRATAALEARIDDFFKRRNAVAHAINLGSSSGPSELAQDIEFFRNLGKALAEAVTRAFGADPSAGA